MNAGTSPRPFPSGLIHTGSNSEAIVTGYRPLVDLAAVNSCEIDGRVLTLASTGWTYKRAFFLYDQVTGTLWYPKQKGLMGIQGKKIDARGCQTQNPDYLSRSPCCTAAGCFF